MKRFITAIAFLSMCFADFGSLYAEIIQVQIPVDGNLCGF